jgi:hypothetical protein
MLAVVFVHIAGVVVSSLIHRENLVRAMVNGYKTGQPAAGIRYKHGFVAATLVLATVGFWGGAADFVPALWSGTAGAAAPRHHAAHQDRR